MFLAIDTSGEQTSVALQHINLDCSKQIIELEYAANSDSHSSSLSKLVSDLLAANKIQVNELRAVILGAGPGSFTGLRIGYAFAKGLALAANIPIYTFSSLRTAAWQFRNQAAKILALDDARRGEFFAAIFAMQQGKFVQEMSDRIINREAVLQWSSGNPEGLLVSANSLVIKEFPNTLAPLKMAISLAEQAAKLWEDRHVNLPESGQLAMEISRLAPSYIRAVAAKTILERLEINA